MRHLHGLFGWIDLMTTDVPAAKTFYGGLFGWTSQDLPMGPDYASTQFSKDGQLVAGMGPDVTRWPGAARGLELVRDVEDADAIVALPSERAVAATQRGRTPQRAPVVRQSA